MIILSLLNCWINFIYKIPAPVIAACIAVTGVWYTDWRNTRRQQAQLRFGQIEAEKSRAAAMRKEVYLSMTGALCRMQSLMARLINEENPDKDSKIASEFSEAAMKVTMIGTTNTALLTQKLASEYSIAFIRLIRGAREINKARSDIALHEKWRDTHWAEFYRVNAEITKMIEEVKIDEVRIKILQKSQKTAQDAANEESKKHLDALQRSAKEQLNYARAFLPIMEKLGNLGTDLLIAIREELEQTTDVEAFRKAFNDSTTKMKLIVQSSIEEAEKAISDDESV